MKGIKFIAPFEDNSGYAESSRQFIKGLVKLGIPVTIRTISFENSHPDLGKETSELLHSLINKKIDYDVVLMHLTPEHFPLFREKNKFNVGYSYWETSRIHPEWVDHCNSIDAVLVACEWNVSAFVNSGVNVPVVKSPPGIDSAEFNNVAPYEINGLKDDVFKFYSIFQWTERKNPLGLLRAYWSAFKAEDNVALILKTYRFDYSPEEIEYIRGEVSRVKTLFPLPRKHPPIYLISKMLSREEIVKLHALGDCFVLFHRSEGFGLPHAEGALSGNPVIATSCGGNTMFMKEDNSYLVDFNWSPFHSMPWIKWYQSDQLWGEPNMEQAVKTMQHVYNNQDEAKQKGLKLKEKVKTDFNWAVAINNLVKNIDKLMEGK